MALPKRKARPEPLFGAAKQLTPSAGHPFNQKLNRLLDEDRVDEPLQEDSTCKHCDHSRPRYDARFGPTTRRRFSHNRIDWYVDANCSITFVSVTTREHHAVWHRG